MSTDGLDGVDHFEERLYAGRDRSYRYVVLFNDPNLDGEWGYSGLTVFETRHGAVGKKAILERKNPEVEYKLDVWG